MDPNFKTNHNRSGLTVVALWEHINIVKLLLQTETNPNLTDNNKKTVLDLAKKIIIKIL